MNNVTHSAYRSEYVIQPPEFPDFVFKMSIKPFEELIEWSKKEYQARLRFLAEGGYWKSLKYFNEEYSPYRILAELHGFRRFCSYLKYNVMWATARGYTRRYIERSYKLRDELMKSPS